MVNIILSQLLSSGQKSQHMTDRKTNRQMKQVMTNSLLCAV